jgi:protein-tyrosine-phosphatase
MALRSWLKQEEVFDVEIENVLSEMDISGEEQLITLSETNFDEFERKVKVARAQDLKDQTAKVRLEKKLQKLRKMWIKGNGQDTSSKVTSPRSSNNDTDEKDIGGHGGNVSKQPSNEALSKARGLKAWMQKENIWEKDLFGVLAGKGIVGGDNIASEFQELIGTRSEFDEVIRDVRVLRAEELKDHASRQRLEQLLTKFEKKWITMTGNKKTNIKKGSKADQGQTKDDPKQNAISPMTNEGRELKAFLQKTNCWQKDLFDILLTMGYSNPDNLCNLTEDEFDEIIRQVRVARAEELKDQTSRTRLEQLLSKFEKEWRKASGIKKTTITNKTKASKGVKKEKPPTDEKIDEMQGQGHELKSYMQKEEFWQLDLYNELLTSNIYGADTLSRLNKTDFDEIIRKVRVARVTELKDAKSKNRLEKVLTKFENEWMKLSGYKKTTIKKGMKAAKGVKKEKAPKELKK